MIRDITKIYGEPNDINTVLASDILTNNGLIVGNGNKSIKVFKVNNNSLITILNGKVEAFPLNMPNKMIGTDENGNLALLEYNEGYTRVKLFGTDNPIVNAQSDNSNVSITNVENSNGFSKFKVINELDNGPGTITIELSTPIDLSDKNTILVAFSEMLDSAIAFSSVYLANDTSEQLLITNTANSSLLLYNGICNIKSGIYDKVKLVYNGQQTNIAAINSILNIMCLILY